MAEQEQPEREQPGAQGGEVSRRYMLKPGAPNYTPQTRDEEPGSDGAHAEEPPAEQDDRQVKRRQ